MKLNINSREMFFFGLFIKYFFIITLIYNPNTISYAQNDDFEYEDEEYEDEEYEDEEYEDEEYEDEEYEDEEDEDEEDEDEEDEDEEEYKQKKRKRKKNNSRSKTIKAKSPPGFSIGFNSSLGFISGKSFSKIPLGGTLVLTSPFGFQVGALKFSISPAIGAYKAYYEEKGTFGVGEFDPNAGEYEKHNYDISLISIGYNFTFANIIFAEGHPGLIGKGLGYRGFIGLSFEKFIYSLGLGIKMRDNNLFSSSIDMPFNVLVGLEGFITSDLGFNNPSYWGGFGVRIDYNIKKAN